MIKLFHNFVGLNAAVERTQPCHLSEMYIVLTK